MERLTKRDLRALLEFIREAYSISDLDTFAHRVISSLPKIVPSEIISYNEVNLGRRRDAYVVHPRDAYTPSQNKIFEQHLHQHPLITHQEKQRDNRALKISDFLTDRQFHRLGMYNEFFRRLSVKYQMAFALPSAAPLIIGIALNRVRRDFSERDRLVLNLLSPHLSQAYRNAEAVTQMQEKLALLNQTLERLDEEIIILRPDGGVQSATARALQWMQDYFGKRSLKATRLPDLLQRWIRHQKVILEGSDDVPPPRKPLVVEREGKRLVVRLIADEDKSLLILEERKTSFQLESLESLGLTRREADVMAWVAEGKTNGEIGMILSLSARTVQKHLEHIFQKLGVETRTSAAAKVYEISHASKC